MVVLSASTMISGLVERTDIALYQAKKLGRNRSYTAPDWHA